MSLTKIIKSQVKFFFSKDIISFFIVHRYDLGVNDDKLRYIAIRPSASLSVLRQKMWFVLNLPDFCEEVLILKAGGVTVPLTELRKGNDPQHPFTIEVWPPGTRLPCCINEVMTIASRVEESDEISVGESTCVSDKLFYPQTCQEQSPNYQKCRYPEDSRHVGLKKPDLLSRVSSTSFFKLYSRKSRENVTHILLKIQSDLTNLSNKLNNLEKRIPVK